MQMRSERVRNTRLKMSFRFEMVFNGRDLISEQLIWFEPYLRMSSMRLNRKLVMVCWGMELGFVLKGFEDHRVMVMVKSAMREKVRVELGFFVTIRFREGWSEVDEHMDVYIELVFHWEIGGRVCIQSYMSKEQLEEDRGYAMEMKVIGWFLLMVLFIYKEQ